MERQRIHRRMATQSLTRVIFDGKGGAKTAERWAVGKRIRECGEALMDRCGC